MKKKTDIPLATIDPVIDDLIPSIAKGASVVFIGTIFGSGLRYIFQIIMARNLGAEIFGLFFLGLAVLRIAGLLSDLGLPNGIIRYIAIYQGQKDKKRIKGIILASLGSVLISGPLLGVLLFAFSNTISINVFREPGLAVVLKYMAVILPFFTVAGVFVYSIQGYKVMTYKMYVRELFEPAMRIVLVVVVFSLGLGLTGALTAYLAVTVLSVILAFHFLKKIFPEISKKNIKPVYEIKKLFHFSWPMLFTFLMGHLLLWTDTLMVGIFRTSEEVGLYGASQRTALLCSIILASFTSIFAPIIADLYNKQQLSTIKDLFKTVAKWAFSLTLPFCLLLVIYAKQILSLFGTQFTDASSTLAILVVGWLINSLMGTLGMMLIMSGRTKIHLINTSILFILNILFNILLIPRYGILGAATATSASVILYNLMTLVAVYVIFRLTPFRQDSIKPIIAGGGSVVAALGFKNIFPNASSSLSILFWGSLIVFLIYFLLFFLLKLSEEDRFILTKILGKLKERK